VHGLHAACGSAVARHQLVHSTRNVIGSWLRMVNVQIIQVMDFSSSNSRSIMLRNAIYTPLRHLSFLVNTSMPHSFFQEPRPPRNPEFTVWHHAPQSPWSRRSEDSRAEFPGPCRRVMLVVFKSNCTCCGVMKRKHCGVIE
jgi:hypothetical protein